MELSELKKREAGEMTGDEALGVVITALERKGNQTLTGDMVAQLILDELKPVASSGYPKFMFGGANKSVLVRDAAQEKALGKGWHEAPRPMYEAGFPKWMQKYFPGVPHPDESMFYQPGTGACERAYAGRDADLWRNQRTRDELLAAGFIQTKVMVHTREQDRALSAAGFIPANRTENRGDL